MAGVRTNIGKAAISDGNLPTLQNLSGLDVDQMDVANDQIGCVATGGDGNKAGGCFSPSGNMM